MWTCGVQRTLGNLLTRTGVLGLAGINSFDSGSHLLGWRGAKPLQNLFLSFTLYVVEREKRISLLDYTCSKRASI